MNTDPTASKGVEYIDLNQNCFQFWLPNYIRRWKSRQHFLKWCEKH